jgi:SAM-dependent methyltransferase
MQKAIPDAASLYRAFVNRISKFCCNLQGRKTRFTHTYYSKGFGGQESISGPGSSLAQTQEIRKELPKLINDLNVTSILDAPCGDFNWMKEVELGDAKYIGVDIVPEIIEMNKAKYSRNNIDFMVMDIVKDDLPCVDIIFCRDCFVHLTFKEIFRSLKKIRASNSTYLLTTTFVQLSENEEIASGWRPINLHKPPFNFPVPIKIINEKCTEQNGKYSDKSLCLWKIKDI